MQRSCLCSICLVRLLRTSGIPELRISLFATDDSVSETTGSLATTVEWSLVAMSVQEGSKVFISYTSSDTEVVLGPISWFPSTSVTQQWWVMLMSHVMPKFATCELILVWDMRCWPRRCFLSRRRALLRCSCWPAWSWSGSRVVRGFDFLVPGRCRISAVAFVRLRVFRASSSHNVYFEVSQQG